MQDLFEDSGEVAYFNAANIGPRLKAVSTAGRAAVDRYSRPWEIAAEDWFSGPEALRSEFTAFLGVGADSVALVPSVSYGIATAAHNLPVPAGSEVLVVEEQYPSNIYAWRRVVRDSGATLRTACRSAETSLHTAVLESINDVTSVVAIPNCHWTDGEPIDLVAVSEACRQHGAALVIDASQSLGARPIAIDEVQPDFVVSVGYKWLLGAYGLGYLYCDEKWRGCGVPIEESWLTRAGSENFAGLVDYVDDYRPGARRFDFGEFPQFISVPMSLAALRQLNAWGPSAIVDQLRGITRTIRAAAAEFGFDQPSEDRCSDHIVSLAFAARERAAEVNERLKRANVIASVRGDSIRISPHMHTTRDHVGRLCEVMEAAQG